MALELNVHPLITGPFVGAPRKSRIGSFPYGTYSKNASDEFKAVVNTDRELPQFAITSRVPVATQQAQVAYEYGPISHNVTQLSTGVVRAAMPIAMGVGVFASGGAITGTGMIQDWSSYPTGPSRWGMSFRNLSVNVNTLGATLNARNGGVWPGFIYIWRPSTMTAVGYVASAYSYSANSWTPGLVTSQNWNEYWSGENYWVCWGGYGVRSFEYNHLLDTTTWLAGDMLIVEYWAGAVFDCGNAGASPGACYMRGIGQIGGGTNNTTGSERSNLNISVATYNTQIPLGGTYTGAVNIPVQGENAAVVPNLITVDPRASRIIRLGFDNPVGVIGPTIGPAVEGIDVTSVAAIDDTTIDLHLVTASQPPAAPIGSATNDTGPEAPSGGAVSSDPTPPAPVAGAFTEDP